MKAFWWFEDNSIAGMARPGFNCTRWFEFPFEEAVLLGWLGQHPSGSRPLEEFQEHIRIYGPKVLPFYALDSETASSKLDSLQEKNGLIKVFDSLAARSKFIGAFEVTADQIHFEFSKQRLLFEVKFLKSLGIKKIVSLTELHHNRETLEDHFESYHLSINDLDAPSLDQVHSLAEILTDAKTNIEKTVIHCLAGIGRTSTMLIAASLVMGERLDDLKHKIAHKNPAFVFAGKQAAFAESIAERCEGANA